MKLNNKGWGTQDMIIYTCIILFFLFLAVILVVIFYQDIGKNPKSDDTQDNKEVLKTKSYYYNMEEKIKGSALKYAFDNDINVSMANIKVSVEDLVNLNYIEEIKDEKSGNKCEGYAVLSQSDNGGYEVSSYIKCDNYESRGF